MLHSVWNCIFCGVNSAVINEFKISTLQVITKYHFACFGHGRLYSMHQLTRHILKWFFFLNKTKLSILLWSFSPRRNTERVKSRGCAWALNWLSIYCCSHQILVSSESKSELPTPISPVCNCVCLSNQPENIDRHEGEAINKLYAL